MPADNQGHGPQPARPVALERLRALPSVDKVLHSSGGERLVQLFGRPFALMAIRDALEATRQAIRDGISYSSTESQIITLAETSLMDQLRPTLRPVINATGVIVHTNLGRALLSKASIEAVTDVARHYSSLEYDLTDGMRGSRSVHTEALLRQLTGAEAAHTVNNNAAAVLLMLTALCQGKEVIISRGQLIEIGGGFRVPDVMAQSGARLVEVGTTNRTHLRDYARAVNDETAAILVAHHSNFRIVGFASEPDLEQLAVLSHDSGILLLYDQGSGAIRDTSNFGLDSEPTVQKALRAGVDIVAFSGDKLLGGPQAGILCGKGKLIGIIKKHPLARAVRADKMCLAALNETVKTHLLDRATDDIPVWRMIGASQEEIEKRAWHWVTRLRDAGVKVHMREGHSTVGGGSLPGSMLPTWLVSVEVDEVEETAAALRAANIPVIGRIADDRLLFDPRTVLIEQEETLLDSIIRFAAVSESESAGSENND